MVSWVLDCPKLGVSRSTNQISQFCRPRPLGLSRRVALRHSIVKGLLPPPPPREIGAERAEISQIGILVGVTGQKIRCRWSSPCRDCLQLLASSPAWQKLWKLHRQACWAKRSAAIPFKLKNTTARVRISSKFKVRMEYSHWATQPSTKELKPLVIPILYVYIIWGSWLAVMKPWEESIVVFETIKSWMRRYVSCWRKWLQVVSRVLE